MMFSQKFSKLSQSIIFSDIFICAEQLHYIKDYMKYKKRI